MYLDAFYKKVIQFIEIGFSHWLKGGEEKNGSSYVAVFNFDYKSEKITSRKL